MNIPLSLTFMIHCLYERFLPRDQLSRELDKIRDRISLGAGLSWDEVKEAILDGAPSLSPSETNFIATQSREPPLPSYRPSLQCAIWEFEAAVGSDFEKEEKNDDSLMKFGSFPVNGATRVDSPEPFQRPSPPQNTNSNDDQSAGAQISRRSTSFDLVRFLNEPLPKSSSCAELSPELEIPRVVRPFDTTIPSFECSPNPPTRPTRRSTMRRRSSEDNDHILLDSNLATSLDCSSPKRKLSSETRRSLDRLAKSKRLSSSPSTSSVFYPGPAERTRSSKARGRASISDDRGTPSSDTRRTKRSRHDRRDDTFLPPNVGTSKSHMTHAKNALGRNPRSKDSSSDEDSSMPSNPMPRSQPEPSSFPSHGHSVPPDMPDLDQALENSDNDGTYGSRSTKRSRRNERRDTSSFEPHFPKTKRTKQKLDTKAGMIIPCTFAGCSKTFTRPYDMNRHINNIHLKDNLGRCRFAEETDGRREPRRLVKPLRRCEFRSRKDMLLRHETGVHRMGNPIDVVLAEDDESYITIGPPLQLHRKAGDE